MSEEERDGSRTSQTVEEKAVEIDQMSGTGSTRELFASPKQRRANIHSAIEKLGQIKLANLAKVSGEKGSSRRRKEARPKKRRRTDFIKPQHKGNDPRKITSDEVKDFYEFYMRKKHTKKQKKISIEPASVSVTTEAPPKDAALQQLSFPFVPQLVNPVAPQALPTMQPLTFPTGFSQMITLPDGTQQPAFFFIMGAPPIVQATSQEGCKTSVAPVMNPLVMSQSQPIGLNVTYPTAGNCSADLSVIEKAMQLAAAGSGSSRVEEQQSPACVQYSTGVEEPKTQLETECHVTQHPPLETIAVEDISVTVQTANSPVAPTPTELILTEPAVDPVAVDQIVAPVSNMGLVVPTTVNQSSRHEVNFPHKSSVKYKVYKFCEATTQTGATEAVASLAETMVEKAKVEGVMLPAAKKDKEGGTKSAKKQVERVRRHPCTVCDKLFFTNHDLKRHKLTHTDERPFMCDICKKTFRTHNELKLHAPIHSDTTPYQCEYCGKEFRTKGCIKSHIKYHIGDKRHKCMECNRAFVKSADLKRHMAGHRNEKNFKCEECGSAFTRRDNLKAHMLLHSRKGVVTCDLCNKEFINEVYLKRHMHIHKQAKKKPYECQWCPKTYEQLEGLRRHIRQHVGDEKFVCKQCDKKFITSIQLKRHLWLTHEQDSPYRRSIL